MKWLCCWIAGVSLATTSASAQLTTWDLRQRLVDTATIVGDSRVVVGGGNAELGTSDLVEVHDLGGALLDTWTLSIPRCRHSGAFVNGRFYFVGGTVPPFNASTDRIDSFTPSGSPLQLTLPIEGGFCQAAGIGDLLMVCGGFNLLPQNSGQFESRIQILDTATNAWSLRSIPFVLASVDATERWLVVAGNDSIFPGNGGIEVYDGSTGTWRSLRGQTLPLRPELVVVDDAAFMFSTSSMDSFALRLDLNDLSLEPLPLLNDREASRLAVADHVICRANGQIFGETSLSSTADLYDTLSRKWHEVDLAHSHIFRAPASDRSSGTAIFAGGFGPGLPQRKKGVDLITAERDLHSLVCVNQDPNSTGQSATLRASGIRTAEVNLFSLVADGLPASIFGVALVSSATTAPVSVGSAVGELCIGTPRVFVQADPLQSDASGRLTVGFDLAALPFPTPIAVAPGSTWYFQTWYRDHGAASRLTDAIAVTFE